MLTGYSYLRCVPYRFLNTHHDTLVQDVVQALPVTERQVMELYFLRFFTEDAAAQAQGIALGTCRAYRQRAMRHLVRTHRLAAALLLQIERY